MGVLNRPAAAALIGILAVACGGESEITLEPGPTQEAASTVVESVPPEAASTVAESVPLDAVPDGWTNYQNETARMRISFPSDWEVIPISEAEQAFAEEMLRQGGLDPESFPQPVVVLAGGAVTTNGALDPNFTVEFYRLPGRFSAEELATDNLRGAKALLPSLETSSRSKVLFGEREGTLLHASVLASDLHNLVPGLPSDPSPFSFVIGYLVDGTVGWTVTCTTSGPDDDVETCESVARSFRLDTP